MMEAQPRVERAPSRRGEHEDLRKIVERQADGIVLVGGDGNICFANPAAERLFGRSRTELERQPFGFAIVTGENTEIEVVRPDGECITAELRVVDVDWNGEPARLVSLRDVTDRRRATERAWQLERERAARAEAEAANRAKSDFLAMMSHELRTPLNAVIGYADLLDLGISGAVNEEQRQQIQRIRTSGRHLLGLVNEVLDLAKIEAGRLTVQISTARVATTADAAIAVVQQQADAKGISFAVNCGHDVLYDGDEDRVRQILVNLLSNALKFTPSGGSVALECGVTDRPDADARLHGAGNWVCMRVSDTGIGIDPAQLPAIFDPFVQVSSGHTRSQGGSGLGLTISRRLARLMRGDLTVRSKVGEGSTFTLWLPAAAPDVPDDARPASGRLEQVSRLRGLSDVGDLVLRESAGVLESFVARLRTDPMLPWAVSLRFSQLADHVACYLADVGGMLMALEELAGQPSPLLRDGTEIERLVAERHGAQRAKLGWTEPALHREYVILREEIERMVRQRASDVPAEVLEEAVTVLRRFVEQAEHLSCRAFLRNGGAG